MLEEHFAAQDFVNSTSSIFEKTNWSKIIGSRKTPLMERAARQADESRYD